MDQPVFTVGKVVEFILHQDWEHCRNFCAEDIKNGNANLLTAVYHNFLMDFNFSPDILLSDQAHFEVLQEMENQEIYRDLVPRINLATSLSWLFKSITGSGSLIFGLRDLSHPDPKRTHIFLSALLNFHLFVTSNLTDSFKAIEEEVAQMQNRKQMLEDSIAKYRKEKAYLIQQAYMDKADVEINEEKIAQTQQKIKKMGMEMQDLKAEVTSLGPEINLLQNLQEERSAENSELDKAIKSINVVQKLDFELEKNLEASKMTEKMKFQYRKGLEDIQTNLAIYQKILLQGQSLREQHVMVRNKPKMQEMLGEEKVLLNREEEEDRRSRELEVKISTLKSNLNTFMLKWNRRKEGKEEEEGELRKEVEENWKTCGEGKMAQINSFRQLEISFSEEKENCQKDEQELRNAYARKTVGPCQYHDGKDILARLTSRLGPAYSRTVSPTQSEAALSRLPRVKPYCLACPE